jgi:phosphoribosyl-AMP cyclohydrolase
MKALEEGTELQLDFTKLQRIAGTESQVVPVVVQDADSREVLVVAYANQAALDHTLKTGVATFWSTSRNELWIKGRTSGDTLQIVDIRVNCEQNSLLYLVRMVGGGVCHEGCRGPHAEDVLLPFAQGWEAGFCKANVIFNE